MCRDPETGKLRVEGWHAPPTVAHPLEETNPMAYEFLFCEAEAAYTAPAFHADNIID
jgi:hypothetical protein